MKVFRLLLTGSVLALACVVFAGLYTAAQLASARAKGVYATAEQGMLARAEKYYSADRDVKILYAGTNSFDGSQPHIWYVIAEIRASSRADGSSLGPSSCDEPGSFFIHTREGWVYIPEGAFPGFIGFWMDVFGWAGEGQSTPSTDRAPDQPARFCR